MSNDRSALGLEPRMPGCPVAHGTSFDPMSPAQAEDPHPWLDEARRHGPAFDLGNGSVYVVDHDLELEVLKDASTYSSARLIDFDALPEAFRAVFPEGPPLVLLDEPAHLRLRRLAQVALSPRLIEGRADHVRAICRDLLDEVVDDGEADLVTAVASRLPILAIVDLVGAPLERAGEFGQWAHDRATLLSVLQGGPMPGAEESAAVIDRATSFTCYLRDFVEERRRHPADDLTSRLIQAEGEPGEPALTTTEVIGLVATILSAGTSTTANFIPAAVYHLLRSGHWPTLVADPSTIPQTVEESLRLWSSVRGVSRRTTREVELAGCPVPAGTLVYLHLGAASRDAEVFPEPHVFDLARTNAHRHLAFGRYKHLCLGAPLARLETRVALELMTTMLPDLRLAEGWAPQWIPSNLTPGLRDLRLSWS